MNTRNTRVAIIGGGISGLSLAFQLKSRDVDVTVFEARERPGGNIQSETREGYLCEWGPNGFLDNEPAMLRLVERLELQDDLVQASSLSNLRWIVRGGVLRELPTHPVKFLSGDVLSLSGRLRVLMEWAQPARRNAADESVFDFAARRIGKEAAEVLVDAMVTGVYAGNARKLSLASAFPRMREMEQQHGGLFKAMRAMRRQSKRAGKKSGSPMGPGGTLTSFVNGMETLVRALVSRLGDDLQLEATIKGLQRNNDSWEIALGSGDIVIADQVVVTTPAWSAAEILRDVDPEISQELETIPAGPVVVVCLGYEESDLQHLARGFGFLVPSREPFPILGTLFDTWVFPNRSQVGHVLFRTLIGGACDPHAVEETDEKLYERAVSSLDKLLGVKAAPHMSYIIRHPRGIPQYPVGHPKRLERIEARLQHHPGLSLTGNSYRGVAMNACVRESEALAANMTSETASVS